MTEDQDLLGQQQRIIERQQKWIRKLIRRMNAKRKYEREMLIHCSATADYINEIDRKDRLALEEPQ
jgi:hypothetical protein